MLNSAVFVFIIFRVQSHIWQPNIGHKLTSLLFLPMFFRFFFRYLSALNVTIIILLIAHLLYNINVCQLVSDFKFVSVISSSFYASLHPPRINSETECRIGDSRVKVQVPPVAAILPDNRCQKVRLVLLRCHLQLVEITTLIKTDMVISRRPAFLD